MYFVPSIATYTVHIIHPASIWMTKALHIHVHLLGEPKSSLNSLHAIIDNSVVTDFRVCTECQWPLVKDKVGSFVSCWSPSWSGWNLRSVILWLNLIVLCCFFLPSLSKGPSVTTVEGPLEDSCKHHRQEQWYLHKLSRNSGELDWSEEISFSVCASLAKSTGFRLPALVS